MCAQIRGEPRREGVRPSPARSGSLEWEYLEMEKHSKRPEADFPLAGAPGLANATRLLYSSARLQAHAMKAVLSYQIEALSFLQRRYEKDIKFLDDLTATEETHDAIDVVSCFWQNAVSDYTGEAGKVASIASALSAETASFVREEADAVVDDMAVRTAA
ncbi:hypothetical protein EV286_10667 [Rhizobium sp. BK251]|nr:hypothetical protein EV286_10667 [Rhizobium sp. BK251]